VSPTAFVQSLIQNVFPQVEAFSIWKDWTRQCPPDSQERQLLERIIDTRWLVNVTHHDFKNPDALWNFLFDDVGLDDASLTSADIEHELPTHTENDM